MPIYKIPLEQAQAEFDAGKISQGQIDDEAIKEFEEKKQRAKGLLNDYYAGKTDLATLHSNLVKNFGDIKPAFDWLLEATGRK